VRAVPPVPPGSRRCGRVPASLVGSAARADPRRRRWRCGSAAPRVPCRVSRRTLKNPFTKLKSWMSRTSEQQREILETLQAQQKRLNKLAEQARKSSAEVYRRTKEIQGDIGSILRALYLDADELPYPQRLTARRFRMNSQNDEDGLTSALIREAGLSARRFVEIGCGKNGGNSGFLAQECGWSGLMIDAHKIRVDYVQRHFGAAVAARQEWVTCDNVNTILGKTGFDDDIDLLSIDIDGNDYWVWEALDAITPGLVIIEFNSMFGPDRAVVVPYNPEFDRHGLAEEHLEWGNFYYGASLRAATHLANRKGYRLVAVEPRGINAYFLRNDLAPSIPAADPADAYRIPPQYNRFASSRDEGFFAFLDRAKLPLVEIEPAE